VSAAEAPEPGKFHFVFNTDDSASVIAASSLDEAVKKLNEQIKEIDKKSDQSDKDKARRKALESALKELKSAVGKIKDSDAVGEKAKLQKDVRRVVVRNVEDFQKISPEAKAEIEKASAKIKVLAQELQSKQKELREAQRNLSQLQGKLRAATVVARVNTREMKPHDLTEAPTGRFTVRRDGDGGQKRIDELEKKLEKLLEEVSALKKDRAK
jgi:chromosome segregation ATPase